MTRRSRAREVALQLLFQRDHNPSIDRAAIEQFARDRLRHPDLVTFCLTLYDGAIAHLEEIDAKLSAAAQNWRLARMTTVDRNVLRLGGYELLHSPDTPAPVALDEMIELGRRFGSADSPAFINGVLDRLRKDAFDQGEAAPPIDDEWARQMEREAKIRSLAYQKAQADQFRKAPEAYWKEAEQEIG